MHTTCVQSMSEDGNVYVYVGLYHVYVGLYHMYVGLYHVYVGLYHVRESKMLKL